jgi:hypothetical protein
LTCGALDLEEGMRGFNSKQLIFVLTLAAIILAATAYRWVTMMR